MDSFKINYGTNNKKNHLLLFKANLLSRVAVGEHLLFLFSITKEYLESVLSTYREINGECTTHIDIALVLVVAIAKRRLTSHYLF